MRYLYISSDLDRIAKEVCNILGIVNSRDAVNGLDFGENLTVVISDFQTPGRGGEKGGRILINEPGLYNLISRSN